MLSHIEYPSAGLIEYDEDRHAAELIEEFLHSVNPRTVGEHVLNNAMAELTVIYGRIAPYEFYPY